MGKPAVSTWVHADHWEPDAVDCDWTSTKARPIGSPPLAGRTIETRKVVPLWRTNVTDVGVPGAVDGRT